MRGTGGGGRAGERGALVAAARLCGSNARVACAAVCREGPRVVGTRGRMGSTDTAVSMRRCAAHSGAAAARERCPRPAPDHRSAGRGPSHTGAADGLAGGRSVLRTSQTCLWADPWVLESPVQGAPVRANGARRGTRGTPRNARNGMPHTCEARLSRPQVGQPPFAARNTRPRNNGPRRGEETQIATGVVTKTGCDVTDDRAEGLLV